MSEKGAAPGAQSETTSLAGMLAKEIRGRVHAPLVKTAGLGNVLAMLAAFVVDQDQRCTALERENERLKGQLRGLVPPGERFAL